MSEYHWISEFQADRKLSKFFFKGLMPCSRSECIAVFSEQESSEIFSVCLFEMSVSWRIIVIFCVKENTNFWYCTDLLSFFSRERRKVTSPWTTLQHNTMLLTAGGSVGECWPGFSTVVFVSFSFLTLFCHKHKMVWGHGNKITACIAKIIHLPTVSCDFWNIWRKF